MGRNGTRPLAGVQDLLPLDDIVDGVLEGVLRNGPQHPVAPLVAQLVR